MIGSKRLGYKCNVNGHRLIYPEDYRSSQNLTLLSSSMINRQTNWQGRRDWIWNFPGSLVATCLTKLCNVEFWIQSFKTRSSLFELFRLVFTFRTLTFFSRHGGHKHRWCGIHCSVLSVNPSCWLVGGSPAEGRRRRSHASRQKYWNIRGHIHYDR